MRIRDLRRILQSVPIAVGAALIIAPGISPASDETASSQDGHAVADLSVSPRAATGYSSVQIGPLLVGYTERFLADRDHSARRVREADLERMERSYREAVGSKLAPEYAISQVPGPGVVRADALLIDHVLDKRDWLAPGMTSFRSAPDVRLVVFLRDSRSNELVDVVGMTLPPRAGRLMVNSPGSYWHYMRLVFDRIATRVRWALEDGVPES